MQKLEYYGRISSYVAKFIFALSLLIFSVSAFLFTVNPSIAETGEFPKISNLSDLQNLKTQEQGKYSVAMSSASVNNSITTQFTILNTQTGASRVYQIFYDKNGGGWKLIELSDSKNNLKLPQAGF